MRQTQNRKKTTIQSILRTHHLLKMAFVFHGMEEAKRKKLFTEIWNAYTQNTSQLAHKRDSAFEWALGFFFVCFYYFAVIFMYFFFILCSTFIIQFYLSGCIEIFPLQRFTCSRFQVCGVVKNNDKSWATWTIMIHCFVHVYLLFCATPR